MRVSNLRKLAIYDRPSRLFSTINSTWVIRCHLVLPSSQFHLVLRSSRSSTFTYKRSGCRQHWHCNASVVFVCTFDDDDDDDDNAAWSVINSGQHSNDIYTSAISRKQMSLMLPISLTPTSTTTRWNSSLFTDDDIPVLGVVLDASAKPVDSCCSVCLHKQHPTRVL